MNALKSTLALFGIVLFSQGFLVSCNQSSNDEEPPRIKEKPHPAIEASDAFFDKFSTLNQDKNGQSFSNEWLQLKSTDFQSTFTVLENGVKRGEIDLRKMHYDGTGYNAAVFECSQIDRPGYIIVLEAQSDPGTAWYSISFISNNCASESFIIKEPRGNSELNALNEVLSLSLIKKELIVRFDKKNIAKYSVIPSDLEQDKDFVYFKQKTR